MRPGTIRVGIGGWNYAPWRGSFYPPGLPQKRELEYAAGRMGAIEINATAYRLQSAAAFARWAEATPQGFVFALKAGHFCTNRRVLADAGEAVTRFLSQGLTALGDRLGPILWQFPATKAFDRDDFAAFLRLLPPEQDGVPLRHALEVRHPSFADAGFVELARMAGAAIVYTDAHAPVADVSGGFAYARLITARAEEPKGYAPAELDRFADLARRWAAGESPAGLPYLAAPAERVAREVFIFMINGAKERVPAGAEALIGRLRA